MDDFTASGIHKPTAEAFYLVLASFTDLSFEVINKVMDVVEEGGPLE